MSLIQIIALIVGVVISAGATVAYVGYASTRSHGRPLPDPTGWLPPRFKFLPKRVTGAYILADLASVILLAVALWQYSWLVWLVVVFVVQPGAVTLLFKLLSHRHNRKIMNQVPTPAKVLLTTPARKPLRLQRDNPF